MQLEVRSQCFLVASLALGASIVLDGCSEGPPTTTIHRGSVTELGQCKIELVDVFAQEDDTRWAKLNVECPQGMEAAPSWTYKTGPVGVVLKDADCLSLGHDIYCVSLQRDLAKLEHSFTADADHAILHRVHR